MQGVFKHINSIIKVSLPASHSKDYLYAPLQTMDRHL